MNRLGRPALIAALVAIALIAGFFFLQATSRFPARLAHYTVDGDARQLIVTAALGRLETIESTSVRESTTTVKVIVLISRRSGTATADIQLIDIPFALSSPLNGRTVTDSEDNAVPVKVSAP